MRNIFILYMPPGNHEAMVHYEDTIRQKVDPARIQQHLSSDMRRKLAEVFGPKRVAVWGSRDSDANRAKFEQMGEGDDLLIVEGDTVKLLGKVAAKTINPELSRELWQNLRGDEEQGWDLIYFIANPLEVGVSWDTFKQLIGYERGFRLRGFMVVRKDRVEEFYSKYDDLYSVLVRMKDGQEAEPLARTLVPEESVIPPRDVPAPLAAAAEDELPEEVSQHVRMQWKLSALGLKSGAKVWVPRGDQQRLQKTFNFSAFENTFASGLDAQVRYIENIDVVWKDQFRIDAAFEVENTTNIYSGLLRFADLATVAPNTAFPFFIVAPHERRQRVLEQLRRPTFTFLHLHQKVRFLPYEAVEEIDSFFDGPGTGLSVNVLRGKSEALA
jgi:hypothetical protein